MDEYFFTMHDLDLLDALQPEIAADDSSRSAEALYRHLSDHWGTYEQEQRAHLALVRAGVRIGARTNKLPKEDELTAPCPNYWLWRLRQSSICPTTRGPRRPVETWFRVPGLADAGSTEGANSAARKLLPVLDLNAEGGHDLELAKGLGLRMELTPSSFKPDDARAMLSEIRRAWTNAQTDEHEGMLRTLIRPTYRRLAELLPSANEQRPDFDADPLSECEVLVRAGPDEFRFVPAGEALLAERAGTFDRLGQPVQVPILVLEGAPQARAPFSRFLGMRPVATALDWRPEPGDQALEGTDLEQFRRGLLSIAPFLLARLEADRAAESQSDQANMYRLIEMLEPVSSLELGCFLDGTQVDVSAGSESYASPDPRVPHAFIVWGENPWPPDEDEAERLASVLCDGLGINAIEAFVALLGTTSDSRRRRLLRLAGAPTDPENLARPPGNGQPDAGALGLDRTIGDAPPPLSENSSEDGTPAVTQYSMSKTPLYGLSDLLIEGEPVAVYGDPSQSPTLGDGDGAPSHAGGGGGSRPYGGRTDLSELDQRGMSIAMAYERRRLGQTTGEPPDSFIFDVSTRAALDRAEASEDFKAAMATIAEDGVNPEAPGFDILSVNPVTGAIDRMIELKSSGNHTRTQDLTWNEWKTARNNKLRHAFYLYLAANLRSDTGGKPFLRMIRDPFGTLLNETVEAQHASKKVRLLLDAFDKAEELELQVRKRSERAAGDT
jgi:hypothetical protein